MGAEISTVDYGPRRVARRVCVAAPAATIFELLVNPHRHVEIDGSGTLRDAAVRGPQRLAAGEKFSIGMTQYGLPYRITSTATEIVDDRTVEWQHPLGHRWRWDLVEMHPDETEVTETFDYSGAKSTAVIVLTRMHLKNARGIEHTLRDLVARFA